MTNIMNIDYVPPPLLIQFNPGKLSDLAMVSFVSHLLHYKVEKMRQTGKKSLTVKDYMANLFDGVQLSSDLASTIKKLPRNMITQKTQWWAYHHEFVFSRKLPADSMIDWLGQLVWLHDGSINYRLTAKKLLKYDKLTNVQMFQLACEYCFVEDVEFLQQTLTDEELNDVCGKVRKYDDVILNYWCGKLHWASCSNQDDIFSVVIGAIINSSRHYYYDEWSAVEYFFKQLDEENRSSCANTIINFCKPRLTWNLLAALNGLELDLLIRENSTRIITALIKERGCFEYTVSIWKRMVEVLDDIDVSQIMHQVNDYNYHERSYVNRLLWEMWQATSEQQRKFIVDGKFRDFTENVLKTTDRFMDYHSPIFSLILDLFSRIDPQRRHEYWLAHWPAMVIGRTSNLSSINRIMKLCFEKDTEIEQLKKTTMIDYEIIAKYCERLIISGRIKEVQNYLEFCTSDQKLICDLKKKIITGMSKKDLFTFLFNFSEDSSMADFDRYLEEIRFTKKKSENFVFKIITNAGNLKKMRVMMDKSLPEVIKFVEKFVPDEENLARMKLIFFQNNRRDSAISVPVLLDLMAWCFNGDQQLIEKFKDILPQSESPKAKATSEQDSLIFDCFLKSYLRCSKND